MCCYYYFIIRSSRNSTQTWAVLWDLMLRCSDYPPGRIIYVSPCLPTRARGRGPAPGEGIGKTDPWVPRPALPVSGEKRAEEHASLCSVTAVSLSDTLLIQYMNIK